MIRSTDFYYTDDPNFPTQHPAAEYTNLSKVHNLNGTHVFENKPQTAQMLQTLLLPITTNDYVPSDLPGVVNEINYDWDTGSVAPGDYYICVKVNDGINEATYCSEATVEVIAN